MGKEKVLKNNNGLSQQTKLDAILQQVVDTLENGRNDIYDIAEDCSQQCANIQKNLQEAIHETKVIVDKVDDSEILYKKARNRLVEVSSNFDSFGEADIEEAYRIAQEILIELESLRQQEFYLRKRRDDLLSELKNFEAINKKADAFLEDSNLALKILRGNIEKVSYTMENARKKQQMELWILEALELERKKVARELHDGPAQILASMLMNLDLISYLCREDKERAEEEMLSVKQMGRETLDEIRRIMFELKPSFLHEVGLTDILKDYFDDYESKYNFQIEYIFMGDKKKYNASLEVALFRLIQEAVSNVRKHSGVKKAMVKLEAKRSGLIVVIKDEGQGFDLDKFMKSKKKSYGIIGMQERTELLGGEMQILSSIGSGTQIIIKVPTKGENNNG